MAEEKITPVAEAAEQAEAPKAEAAEKKAAAKKPAAKKPAAEKAEGEKKPAAKKAPAKKADKEEAKPAKKAPAKKAAQPAGTVKITLKRSLVGRTGKQIAVANSLGLKRTGDTTVQPDNAPTQGKIAKIAFLLEVSKA